MKFASFALIAFFCLALVSGSYAAPTYLGAGIADDPYRIDTCLELQDMNYHLGDTNVYFTLDANIDCSETANWVIGPGTTKLRGFDPIGKYSLTGAPYPLAFQGHFDGNNMEIRNLMIWSDVSQHNGLFGYTYSAKISNVGIVDVNIWSCMGRSGALIGTMKEYTDVNNVWVLGGTIFDSHYVGGLIGIASPFGTARSDVNQVFVKDVNVFAYRQADYSPTCTGDAGCTQCSADHVGGIIGTANEVNLWHAYTTASVSGVNGFLTDNNGAMIGDCGVDCSADLTVTESYWNPTDAKVALATSRYMVQFGTQSTQVNMLKQATYVNWNFFDIWNIVEDANTPYFIRMPIYTSPYVAPYVIPIPDLNFVSIESDLFAPPIKTYAYVIDGNLRIDFNVFISDNNRLILDLNYFEYADGNAVIVKDLNLTSLVCSDQDWNDKPSTCHWDFNISSSLVPDGNYYLKALIRTDTNTVGKISSQSFLIANDVNIVIKTPIDEETGQPIDTVSIYTWTVRIYDSSGMRYYPLQKDQNGFSGPLGESIIVAIDTNDSTAYYQRQYTLQFDAATETYTLQPYLIKQSVSGNFIFMVTNASTTNPIKDVTIAVSGFIPSSGTVTIQTITTDATGQATIPLRLSSPYTIVFTYNGEVVLTDTITPTSGSLYYRAALNIAGTTPTSLPIGNLIVSSVPSTTYLLMTSTGKLDLNLAITMTNKTVSDMLVRILDNNGCVYDLNRFTGPWTDANKIYYPAVDLNTGTNYLGVVCKIDTRYAVYAIVDVNTTDGNRFSAASKKYTIVTSESYSLTYLLAQLAGQLNKPGSQMITSFLAVFITLLAASSVAVAGVRDVAMLCIMSLALLGFFVWIAWFPLLPFAFLCLVSVSMLILVRGAF